MGFDIAANTTTCNFVQIDLAAIHKENPLAPVRGELERHTSHTAAVAFALFECAMQIPRASIVVHLLKRGVDLQAIQKRERLRNPVAGMNKQAVIRLKRKHGRTRLGLTEASGEFIEARRLGLAGILEVDK